MFEKKNLFAALLVITFLSFLCFSCATSIRDLERKKEAGKSIQEVYSAMSYVWRHSESSHVETRYKMGDVDFAKDEKCIFTKWSGAMDIGIFFEPQGESSCKVAFVKGGIAGAGFRGTTINLLIEETHYYLDNGKDAYLEYTRGEHEKRIKKME